MFSPSARKLNTSFAGRLISVTTVTSRAIWLLPPDRRSGLLSLEDLLEPFHVRGRFLAHRARQQWAHKRHQPGRLRVHSHRHVGRAVVLVERVLAVRLER